MTNFEIACFIIFMIMIIGTILVGTGVTINDKFHKRKSDINRSLDNSVEFSNRNNRGNRGHNKNNNIGEEVIEDLIICDMLGLFR